MSGIWPDLVTLLLSREFAILGSGLVGRPVASDTRGPRFESSHWQNLLWTFTVNCTVKTKIKKKRPRMAHLKKILQFRIVHQLLQFLLMLMAVFNSTKCLSFLVTKRQSPKIIYSHLKSDQSHAPFKSRLRK